MKHSLITTEFPVSVHCRRSILRRSGLMLAGLLLGALTLPAQQPKKATAPQPKNPVSGWASLFNGKDLAGWVEVGAEKWEVKDGVIHGQGVTSEYGYLRTEKTYVDFQLALKFKCEADGNSGVFFHCEFEPGTPKVKQGLQVEIDRRLGYHTGGIYGDGRKWIAWPSPVNESVIRPYDWNELLIQVEANHYVVRLNGVVVLDFTDPTPMSFDGHIALQLHSGGQGNMKFKDIFLRDLTKR